MALVNIPSVSAPGEAFDKGQDMFAKFLTGYQNKEKLIQAAKEAEQLNQYRQGQLGIQRGELGLRRQAEQRQQTLMPYLIEQYKDLHGGKISENQIKGLQAAIAQHEYDQAMQGANEQAAAPSVASPLPEQAPANTGKDMSASEQMPQVSLEDIMKPLMESGFNVKSWPPQSVASQVKRQVYNPNLNIQDSPVFQPGTEDEIAAQSNVPQPQEPQQQAPGQQPAAPSAPSAPQEIVLRPGRKGAELQDRLAGTSLGKPIKYNYGKDGWIYAEYPSGKVTATQNPGAVAGEGPVKETPAEKRKNDLEAKIALQKEKANLRNQAIDEKDRLKTVHEVNATANALIPHMKTMARLKEILDKKPNLTGKATALKHWAGQDNDKDVGTFASGALSLQTKLTKDLSSRGGYGAANIVKSSKPDIGNNGEFNKGSLGELIRNSVDSFLEMKTDYERVNPGKEFPYKLENIFKTLDVETPDGKVLTVPTKGALELIKEHPDHRIIG